MRIIGIDFGSRRIGVAVSDEARQFALPSKVIPNTPYALKEIEKIAADSNSKECVIGESRDYKGQPNEIFNAVEIFKKKLESDGFVVHNELEFMTSMQAERLQGKHDKLDASAAALILQSYLDKLKINEASN